jgi:hypothetical protein
MARDGREMIRWMSSHLNRRSFGKAIVTAYIARGQGRDRQWLIPCALFSGDSIQSTMV